MVKLELVFLVGGLRLEEGEVRFVYYFEFQLV